MRQFQIGKRQPVLLHLIQRTEFAETINPCVP